MKKLYTFNCKQCKKDFTSDKRRLNDNGIRVFCCKQCQDLFRRENKKIKIVQCLHCNKSFEKTIRQLELHPNSFCNNSCSAAFNNKGICRNKKKPTKTCVCKKCLCEYQYHPKNHRNETYCISCKKIIKQDYANYNHHRDKHIGSYRVTEKKHASVRLFNRSWNKHLTKLPCACCGYNKYVELAHIKPVASFPDEVLLSEVNNELNIVQLCPNCHWELDNGHMKVIKPDKDTVLIEKTK